MRSCDQAQSRRECEVTTCRSDHIHQATQSHRHTLTNTCLTGLGVSIMRASNLHAIFCQVARNQFSPATGHRNSACTVSAGRLLWRSCDGAGGPCGGAGAVDLRNSLAATFGVELPATVVYDHPTITALAAFIAKLLAKLPKKARIACLPAGFKAALTCLQLSFDDARLHRGTRFPHAGNLCVYHQHPSAATVICDNVIAETSVCATAHRRILQHLPRERAGPVSSWRSRCTSCLRSSSWRLVVGAMPTTTALLHPTWSASAACCPKPPQVGHRARRHFAGCSGCVGGHIVEAIQVSVCSKLRRGSSSCQLCIYS